MYFIFFYIILYIYILGTMLYHSDQPLSTSLTKQSPTLAALSVFIFSHYIRGIERYMYSDLRIVLNKLLLLGNILLFQWYYDN